MTESHVCLRGVSMQFGSQRVLRGIDLEVGRGQLAVILGGSGSGKTTLLRIIVGLLRPSAGAVIIDGRNIAELGAEGLRRARERWAMVFQYSALLDSLSVFDNVALPLREHERPTAAACERRVAAVLESLELTGTEARYPSELSGGMRKRVALARALIREPSVIVSDEPASGLDPLTARTVDKLIFDACKRRGVTSVVISHDMAEASRLADCVFVLDEGAVAASGTVSAVRGQTGSLAARFFEASRID